MKRTTGQDQNIDTGVVRKKVIVKHHPVGLYRFRKFKTPTPTQTPGAGVATLESTPGGCVILVIGCVI